MNIPAALLSFISEQTALVVDPATDILVEKLQQRFGNSLQAILFYGSCQRSGDYHSGILDLYVLVDSYHNAYKKSYLAWLNKLLPPNVFYLEATAGNQPIRAKYAVLTLHDFIRGTSKHWFHSYLWCRFAQPLRVIFHGSEQILTQINLGSAQAAITFISRVIPTLPSNFDARKLWYHAFALSYGAELRPEREGYSTNLYNIAENYYEQLTRLALPALPFRINCTNDTPASCYALISELSRRHCRQSWKIRKIQGKLLSILRLLKALMTFHGGISYIRWKVERHSGITFQKPADGKPETLFQLCKSFWQAYRQGGFR
ncbi:MAG: hypothetical protein U9P07_08685 [Pseudomonadota bacterium]|nr:hypothetical protein [Pseudomonadota bacterium]